MADDSPRNGRMQQSFGQRVVLDEDEIAGSDQIQHLRLKPTPDPVVDSYFNRSKERF
jgi:hypothetical protein